MNFKMGHFVRPSDKMFDPAIFLIFQGATLCRAILKKNNWDILADFILDITLLPCIRGSSVRLQQHQALVALLFIAAIDCLKPMRYL